MTAESRWAPWCVAIGLAIVSPVEAQQPAATILGRWHGQSVCIKAEWNAACHDEEVVYNFVPAAAGSGRVTLHAFKVVGGAMEPMYDLDFALDSAAGYWSADFTNARVHIRWSYAVNGAALKGRVVDLPSMRMARLVTASRDSTVE